MIGLLNLGSLVLEIIALLLPITIIFFRNGDFKNESI